MHRFFVGALAVGVPLVGRHSVPAIRGRRMPSFEFRGMQCPASCSVLPVYHFQEQPNDSCFHLVSRRGRRDRPFRRGQLCPARSFTSPG